MLAVSQSTTNEISQVSVPNTDRNNDSSLITEEIKKKLHEKVSKELSDPKNKDKDNVWGNERYNQLVQEAIKEIKIVNRLNQEFKDLPNTEVNRKLFDKRYKEESLLEYREALEMQNSQIEKLEYLRDVLGSKVSDLKSQIETESSLILPKVESEIKVNKDPINLSFSRKIGNDTYQGYDVKASLSSEGKLSVVDKNSKQDLSNNFTVLYLDKDNKIKDQKGNIITHLENDYGKINADFYAQRIDKEALNSKGLAGLKEGNLNSFKLNGKQVIFAKATDVIRDEVKQDQTKKDDKKQDTIKQIPWSKVTYHEQVNGAWVEKNVYVRKNLDNNKKEILEVFLGKDSSGKEIWKDSAKVDYPKLNLVSYSKSKGEFYNQSGEKLKTFDTLNGGKLDPSLVKGLLNNSRDKLFTLKETSLNNLHIQGKRPIFIEIP